MVSSKSEFQERRGRVAVGPVLERCLESVVLTLSFLGPDPEPLSTALHEHYCDLLAMLYRNTKLEATFLVCIVFTIFLLRSKLVPFSGRRAWHFVTGMAEIDSLDLLELDTLPGWVGVLHGAPGLKPVVVLGGGLDAEPAGT